MDAIQVLFALPLVLPFGCDLIFLTLILFTSFVFFQKDLSPLVKQLAPGEDDSGSQIPYVA